MTRALQKRTASISVDSLLADSPWFGQIAEAARHQVRADIVERAITSGESLGYQGESQRHWYGVLEGLLKWSRLLDTDRLVARALVGLVHPLLNPRGERYLTISQEELANLATVSRQRCNQSLVAMKCAGLVQLEYGAIVVIDLDALQRSAE